MALPGYKAAKHVPTASGEQVQPAGVDLRVASVFEFKGPGVLGVNKRLLSDVVELEPRDSHWMLKPGGYKVRFLDIVEVPLGYVGLCFPRSSLLRMGAYLGCAVWDPGYKGRGEALLHVTNPHGISLEMGARIAQLVFITLEDIPKEGYKGIYNRENI